MPIVVDASVAVKFSVEEAGTAAALDLIHREPKLVAPDLILVEVANAFWAMARNGRLTMVHAERFLSDLPSYFTRLYAAGALTPRALQIAARLEHPVYDCLYVALAERLHCRLVTADAKFHRKAVDVFPVDLLGLDQA